MGDTVGGVPPLAPPAGKAVPATGNLQETRNSIWGALRDALHSATHLQIVTIIGDSEVTLATKEGLGKVVVGTPAKPYKVLATNINLVDGDISQALSPELLVVGQEGIVQLHKDMIAQGHAIVKDNLNLLKELARELNALHD